MDLDTSEWASHMRVSARPNDRDFWRLKFREAPTITLDGIAMDQVVEAVAGANGYVIIEIPDEYGKPQLADVVLGDRVIDRVIATSRRVGVVRISGRRR